MFKIHREIRAIIGGPPLCVGVLIAGAIPFASAGLAALLVVVSR